MKSLKSSVNVFMFLQLVENILTGLKMIVVQVLTLSYRRKQD